MENARIVELKDLLEQAASCVFFGGAGVSTESGVPDFRGEHGIYKQNIRGEEVLTPYYLHHHTEDFYRFNRHFFWLDGIEPNACHKVLAALERLGKLSAVVTQNIDGLHQAAGSRQVIELHGNSGRHYCEDCGKRYTDEAVRAMDLVPRCRVCNGLIRPDIVLYDEALNSAAIRQAVEAISEADLLIIGGTSLTVYPAAGLIHYQKSRGKKVLINQTPTPSDELADLIIRDPIGQVFAKLAELMGITY